MVPVVAKRGMKADGMKRALQVLGGEAARIEECGGLDANVLDVMRAVVNVRGCMSASRAPFPGVERARVPRMATAGRLCVYRCRRMNWLFARTLNMAAGVAVSCVACLAGG